MTDLHSIIDRIHAEAFANASCAMLVVDGVSGAVLHANPAAAELSGYAMDELTGRHVGDLLPPETRDAVQQRVCDAVAHGAVRDVDLACRRADGTRLPVQLRMHVLEDGGRPLIVVHLRDQARRRELTRALDEAHLQAVTARSQNEAKSRFFAGMTHELRTPLNAVIGLTDMLSRMDLAPDARDTVAMLEKSGRVLLRLINDILDVSKIEAGKLDMENVPFELTGMLRDLADIYALQCREKGLEFVYRADTALPTHAVGDGGRIRQVLANLLDNALKFTESGSVSLDVRMLAQAAGAWTLECRVSDTGIGIPAHRVSEMFKPYTQATGDTARRYGGTGLGLTICTMLVDLMGGSIDVQSREGRGSDFRFDVRLGVPATTAAASPARRPQEPLPQLRLLLVEDNKINQRVALGMLDKLGHTTRTAETGAAALESLAAHEFDLVFMDVQLPDRSGLEVTRRLRAGDAGERNRRVPVIAMTAHATRQDRLTCLDAGMDDYVAKPISSERISEAMRRVLYGKGAETGRICDFDLLVEQLEGDVDLAHEIIDLFLDDAHARLDRIAEAVGTYDFDTVSREAKTLEGAALNVHAEAMVTLLAEMLAAARNKEEEYAKSLVEEMRRQLDAVAACV